MSRFKNAFGTPPAPNTAARGCAACFAMLTTYGRLNKIGFTFTKKLRQYRIIPALRLKHRSGSCGTASALPKCSIRHPVLSALLAWHLPHLARRIGT
jgi:hypothetical protein